MDDVLPPEVGVQNQEVGPQLRALRSRQRMTLKEVAARAGISEGFLSQVERNVTGVSLPTLRRISEALGVTIADLFEPDQSLRPHVLRRAEAPVMEFDHWRNHLLTPRPLRNLEVFWLELEPGSSTADLPFTHGASEEVFILVKGAVEVRVNGRSHHLEQGDSITYSSASPHVASNTSDATAEAIIALSPPSI